MANVIAQFLIGIGYQYDDKGERAAKSGMESIKSSTLAIGSALAAAAIGAGAKVDQLAEKSRKLQDQLYRTNTQTTWAQGYGVALTELGGNADDAVGRITGLEQKLAALKMGDRSFVDSLGVAGFNAGDLSQAKDAQDFITRAADQFSRATHTQQVNMANVLGLTDAEFKLWQQGGSYVTEHSKKLAEQLGYTESLNQKQYEYSQSWVQLNLEMDKAGNTISNIMLPGMTRLVRYANDFVGAFNKFSMENPDEVSSALTGGGIAATGFGLSTLGAAASRLGVPGAGALRMAGPVGAAAGVSIAVEPWVDKGLNAMFGGSEYFQNLRTAPTWGEFGDALMGQRETPPEVQKYLEYHRRHYVIPTNVQPDYLKSNVPTLPYWLQQQSGPTHGNDYAPSAYASPDYNAAAVGGVAAFAVSALPPIRVDNKLSMTGTVELDGRQVGEIIDVKIDEHNQQAIAQYDTRVNR